MQQPSAAEGIVVFGEARVGKTCFIDMLTKGRHFVSYTGVLTDDPRYQMSIDGETVDAEFMDLSSTTIRTADSTFSSDVFMDILTRASGVVLLYDVTNRESFEQITNQAYMCQSRRASDRAVEKGSRLRIGARLGTKPGHEAFRIIDTRPKRY
ncbi:hypothetical protein FB567DRAFT_596907 [Paraphoma chrysanthemicola]|uniref:Uncharacterized protein n=1 Tax=Paraphoma chrysanthemicola TaxID=798071 RepID=A0A8K0QWG0_9PLEO|nr:hypothetical protein FB567DRAFT_596907 [Paraphoma chrysanthemicola]